MWSIAWQIRKVRIYNVRCTACTCHKSLILCTFILFWYGISTQAGYILHHFLAIKSFLHGHKFHPCCRRYLNLSIKEVYINFSLSCEDAIFSYWQLSLILVMFRRKFLYKILSISYPNLLSDFSDFLWYANVKLYYMLLTQKCMAMPAIRSFSYLMTKI